MCTGAILYLWHYLLACCAREGGAIRAQPVSLQLHENALEPISSAVVVIDNSPQRHVNETVRSAPPQTNREEHCAISGAAPPDEARSVETKPRLVEMATTADALLDRIDEFQSLPPTGLPNIGNTCYINAALQTLFRIPGVRRCAARWALTNPPMRNEYDANDRLARTFCALVECVADGKASTAARSERLRKFVNQLHLMDNKMFRHGAQGDSHNVVITVLSSLIHHCRSKSAHNNAASELDLANPEEHWLSFGAPLAGDALLSGCCGQYVDAMTCDSCSLVGGALPCGFTVLTISADGRSHEDTVQRVLDQSLSIAANSARPCPRCRGTAHSMRRVFTKVPRDVLLLSLKLHYLDDAGNMRKTHRGTRLDSQLVLTDALGCEITFSPISGTIHQGSCHGGHYTAVVRNEVCPPRMDHNNGKGAGCWVADDSYVSYSPTPLESYSRFFSVIALKRTHTKPPTMQRLANILLPEFKARLWDTVDWDGFDFSDLHDEAEFVEALGVVEDCEIAAVKRVAKQFLELSH